MFCRTSLHQNVFVSNVFHRSDRRGRTTRSIGRSLDIDDNIVRHHNAGPPHQDPSSANDFVHILVALSLQGGTVVL
jgi:hypothetical protein